MDRVNIVSGFLGTSRNIFMNVSFHFVQLTTAFDGAIAIGKSFVLNATLLESTEIDVMIDLLILNRQHEIYVRKLLSNLKSIKSLIETRVRSFAEKLSKLHEIVQFRSAVPSIQIFPKFRELTDEWMALHNLSYVLSQQNQINNYLQHLSELCSQQQYDEIVHKLLGENQVETDHTRLQKRRHLKLDATSSSAAAEMPMSGSSISIVQAPESNSEVECKTERKAIKIILRSTFIACFFSTFPCRLNIWASALMCWLKVEFYCRAYLRWVVLCGTRKFTDFIVLKLRNFSSQNQSCE